MTTRRTFGLWLEVAVHAGLAGCGAAADHTATLRRLRDAIHAEVTGPMVLEDHNQLVEEVVRSGALEGLRMFELEQRIGRGEQCGVRAICAQRGFRATDWIYEVGRHPDDPELAAGPTLLVGFDSAGVVDRTFYLTRR